MLTEVVVVAVPTSLVDVVIAVMTPGVVVAVLIGMTPPTGVAAPPHSVAVGRVTETASQALG